MIQQQSILTGRTWVITKFVIHKKQKIKHRNSENQSFPEDYRAKLTGKLDSIFNLPTAVIVASAVRQVQGVVVAGSGQPKIRFVVINTGVIGCC